MLVIIWRTKVRASIPDVKNLIWNFTLRNSCKVISVLPVTVSGQLDNFKTSKTVRLTPKAITCYWPTFINDIMKNIRERLMTMSMTAWLGQRQWWHIDMMLWKRPNYFFLVFSDIDFIIWTILYTRLYSLYSLQTSLYCLYHKLTLNG